MTKSNNQEPLLEPNQFSDHLRGKKGEILLAAFQCIAEKGIAGTSTHAIASKAGLNQGSIHYYFESKAQLFKEVLEILFYNSTTNIEAVAASDLPPTQKLDHILSLGHSLVGPRRDEVIVFLAFWTHAMSVGGDMLRLYQELFRRFRTSVIKVLKEGEKTSIFKPGASEEMALLIVGAVEGLGLQFVMDPEHVPVEKAVNLLKNLVRRVIKG